MFKYILLFIIYLLFAFKAISKPFNFDGLAKLSLDDLQSITSVDIYDDNLSIDELNITLKELSISDLIYDINYSETDKYFIINIIESDFIENIYINNNTWIKDEIILNNLNSKINFFLSKNRIKKDIDIIKNIYRTKGFQDISVIAKVEKFSQDRVNLIYEVKENIQQKITAIKFIGNDFFSNNYLNSQINSQSIKFYNIFKSGSNLNYSSFEFDKNQIISLYKDDGFFNVKVSYLIEKNTFNSNVLYFYIDEGDRFKIENLEFKIDDNILNISLNDLISNFKNILSKNNFFYDKILINEYQELFNINLIENNISNTTIEHKIVENNNYLNLHFFSQKKNPVIINKININGNSVTKDKTIRSKISLEPGQYLNKYTIDNSLKNLKRYPYIKDVKIDTFINNQLADIDINIDEELKTGNILLAGTLNADTGAGLTFGIEDKNIFGSGNSIDSNFSINSEDIKFDLNYTQYPVMNPNLTNKYTLFNQDNDYTNSFGYKATRKGLGYSVNFKESDKISYGVGINYESFKGHSAVNTTSSAINDNIGKFDNYKLNFSHKYDSSNDYIYPTDGIINRVNLTLSPNDFSDSAYYKISISNKNYKKFKKSENYLFLNNNYGYAKSLSGKLKTKDAFGLGGLNFKGFDYKGIGPYDGKIYLGGNEYFTSTIGYGSSFIFDDKDNINIKFFLTTGSIWNSDYATSTDIDLRTSVGTSFDVLTPVGPISLSYAIPIEKNKTDKTRSFNFSIGTSFW